MTVLKTHSKLHMKTIQTRKIHKFTPRIFLLELHSIVVKKKNNIYHLFRIAYHWGANLF